MQIVSAEARSSARVLFACASACAASLLLAPGCGGSAFTSGSPVGDGGKSGSSSGASSSSSGGGSGGDGGACSGACVPAPPTSDWKGPFEVYDGLAPAPGCASAWTADYAGYSGPLTAPDAACSCSCGPPADVGCSVEVTAWPDSRCGMQGGGNACSMQTVGDACSTLSGCSGATYVSALLPTVVGGSCSPAGPVAAAVPPLSWARVVRACAPAPAFAGSCAAGALCTPAASTGAGICVRHDGDVLCPAGSPYSVKAVASESESAVDTRGCGACGCGSVTGATCDRALYIGTSCGGPFTTQTLPIDCASTPTLDKAAYTKAATGGSCAGASLPTGSAAPAQSSTFCCLP